MAAIDDLFAEYEGVDLITPSYKSPEDYYPLIDEYSAQYGMDPDLMKRQAKQESNFDHLAVSSAGAKGVMQLMDGTAKDLGVTDSFDPHQNIRGGIDYMSQQFKRYEGDKRKALAAYNAGPGNLNRRVKKYGKDWLKHMPEETQDYVARILGKENDVLALLDEYDGMDLGMEDVPIETPVQTEIPVAETQDIDTLLTEYEGIDLDTLETPDALTEMDQASELVPPPVIPEDVEGLRAVGNAQIPEELKATGPIPGIPNQDGITETPIDFGTQKVSAEEYMGLIDNGAKPEDLEIIVPADTFNDEAIKWATEKYGELDSDFLKAITSGSMTIVFDHVAARDALTGGKDAKKINQLRKDFETAVSENPREANNLFTKGVNSVFEMAPAMAAGTALAIPTGGVGGIAFWGLQGMGAMYSEMIEAGIPHETALYLSAPGGAVYAAIEAVQVSKVTGIGKGVTTAVKKIGIELGKKLAGQGTKAVSKEVAKKVATKHLKDVGINVLEEVAQEAVTVGAVEAGKGIEGKDNITWGEAGNRLLETAKQSIVPIAMLGVFGSAVNARGVWKQTKNTQKEEEFRQELEKDVISRVTKRGVEEGLTEEESLNRATSKVKESSTEKLLNIYGYLEETAEEGRVDKRKDAFAGMSNEYFKPDDNIQPPDEPKPAGAAQGMSPSESARAGVELGLTEQEDEQNAYNDQIRTALEEKKGIKPTREVIQQIVKEQTGETISKEEATETFKQLYGTTPEMYQKEQQQKRTQEIKEQFQVESPTKEVEPEQDQLNTAQEAVEALAFMLMKQQGAKMGSLEGVSLEQVMDRDYGLDEFIETLDIDPLRKRQMKGVLKDTRDVVFTNQDNKGVQGRRAYDKTGEDLFALKKAGKIKNFTVANLDIQNLGGLNDALGHEGANDVLREIGNIIRKHTDAMKDSRSVLDKLGGDELGTLSTASKTQLKRAYQAASDEITQYIANTTVEGLKGKTIKLSEVLHPKHDNLQTGAGRITFSVIDSKDLPSAIGFSDMAREVDSDAEIAKQEDIARTAEEKGYFKDKDGKWRKDGSIKREQTRTDRTDRRAEAEETRREPEAQSRESQVDQQTVSPARSETTGEQQKAAVTPPKQATPRTDRRKKTLDRFKQAIKDARANALVQRDNRGTVFYAGMPLDAMANQIIVGATYIAEGTINFAQWSTKMVKEFGKTIKPHLRRLYKASKKEATKMLDKPVVPKKVESAEERRAKIKTSVKEVRKIKGTLKKPGMAFVKETQKPTLARTDHTPPVTKPVEKPVQKSVEKTDNATSLKNAVMDKVREMLGLSKLPSAERISFESVLQKVLNEGLTEGAMDLAESVVKNPRMINEVEYVTLTVREAQLESQYEKLMKESAEAYKKGDKKQANILGDRADSNKKKRDILQRASKYSGSKVARALAIRRIAIERDTYTIANIEREAIVAKKGELTQQQKFAFSNLTDKIDEQQKIIDKLEKEISEMDKANSEKVINEVSRTVRRYKKSDLQQERKALKGDLAKLGFRVNEITGIPFEAAQIISQIAITHIKEGALTLQEVAEKVQKDVPDISTNDIYASLGGRINRETKVVVDEINDTVKELKSQARIIDKINKALDAEKPIEERFDPKQKRNPPSETLKVFREELKRLQQNAYRSIKENAQLEKVIGKIEEIEDALNKGIIFTKDKNNKPIPKRPDILEATKKFNELKRLMNTQAVIKDYENQLATGDYKISVPKKITVKNEALQEALVKRKLLRREVNTRIEDMKSKSVLEHILGPLLASRALLATGDVSYAYRQAALMSARRPIMAAKSFGLAFQTLFSETKAAQIDLVLRNRPGFMEGERAGLFLSKLDGKLSEREELFMSKLGKNIPIIGKLLAPMRKVMEASERNMITGLNLMRVATFDQFMAKYPLATIEEKEAWANFVNKSSGRGDIVARGDAAKVLANTFFAPRWAVSRFQAPYLLVKHVVKGDKKIAWEIAQDYLWFTGLGMTVLFLSNLAGDDVGDDPESSDFGKIISGDTRIDIWGGFQQPASLIARGIWNPSIDIISGKGVDKNYDPWSLGGRFLKYKLSPTINLPASLISGKNVMGQEQGVVESLIRSYTPIMLQGVYDVYQNTKSPAKAAAVGIMEGLGINIQEHEKRSSSGRRTRRTERTRRTRRSR